MKFTGSRASWSGAARGRAGFQLGRGSAKLFRHFTKNLRGTAFGRGNGFFLEGLAHPVQFRAQAAADLFQFVHDEYACNLAARFRYYRNAREEPQGGTLPLPYRWQWRIDRWKNTLRGIFGGGEEQPRPKLCPACGTLVGTTATRCHECGTSLRFSVAAASRTLSKLFGERTPATSVLLMANIFMFGVCWLATVSSGRGGGLSILWGLSGETLYKLGATHPGAIFLGHEWYRLVTAMFLHGGLIHIGFNMMALMDLGPAVEEVYGSARFLFLYTVTGAAGFLLSALLGHQSVGASGALMGLIGLLIAITTRRGGAHMQQLRSRLVSWVVSIFVIGFLMAGVDNAAHFGGLAAGFALGKVFADRQPFQGPELKRAYLLGWIAGIVILASIGFMVKDLLQKY